MVRNCPKCGKELPDDAKFCMNCGYTLDSNARNSNSNIFSNGKIFIILIAAVLIIGGLFMLTYNGSSSSDVVDNVEHVDLTITDVGGWDSSNSYTLYTEALFNSVPSDKKGYNIKATYYDENGTKIGQEIESLSNVYYDSDYPLSFAFYTAYKKPNPDHVLVEIIKDGRTIDNFTANVDKNKIDYLN